MAQSDVDGRSDQLSLHLGQRVSEHMFCLDIHRSFTQSLSRHRELLSNAAIAATSMYLCRAVAHLLALVLKAYLCVGISGCTAYSSQP